MWSKIRQLISWAGRNIIKVTILIAILIAIGLEVKDLIDFRNAIRGAINVTANPPPVGVGGGSYQYRVNLGAAATTRSAKVIWVEVDNRAYPSISNIQTTGSGWNTYRLPGNKALASGNGLTDVGLSFDTQPKDVSYTLGELSTNIRFDYVMFWTTFNLKMDYVTQVPIPFNPISTYPQVMNPAAWTSGTMPFPPGDWHGDEE